MCVMLSGRSDRYTFKCGQCVECRLAYSREWAIRIVHEAQSHSANCMLNLTYDNEHLPPFGQLVKSDLQKFFKRLRKNTGPFSYVAAGEYGDRSRRPHFHIALFGLDFSADRVIFGKSVNGEPTFISQEVSKSWSLGNHVIGSLNFESAAYIARYIMKKIKGDNLCPVPLAIDPDSGVMILPNPEFLLASKGIGKSWFYAHFMHDVFPHASVVTPQGSRAPVPRYYKNLLKDMGADLALDMQYRTSERIKYDFDENSDARRQSRARYASAKSNLFSRSVGD